MPSITIRSIMEDLRAENEALQKALRLSALRLHTVCRAIELGFGAHVEDFNKCEAAPCPEAHTLLKEKHAKAK